MKVELRNIGPINRAEIDLRDFAVLVGPNASGKTTLSTACYAVLRSHRMAERVTRSSLLDSILTARARSEPQDLSEAAQRFATIFRATLATELERCYTPDLNKLPRRGRAGGGSAPRIIVSDTSDETGSWKLVFRIKDGGLALEPRAPGYRLPDLSSLLPTEGERYGQVVRRLQDNRDWVNPVYFPAARSGYVQMQTVLSSLLIAALGRGIFDQLSLGKISGIAADFLQFLAEMDATKSSSLPSDSADRLETELLHGRVRLHAAGDAAKTIEFAPEGIHEYWPMDAAATSIAELAPLMLYLRHRAMPSDLLFIDEPEAHLHPKNQLVLADVLLDLCSLIRGMVVGTHSEFFVTGVSNGLLRRRSNGTRRHPPVSLYELVPAQTTGGFEACQIEVDETAGFNVEQFADVAEAALDEAEELFTEHQRQGS